MSNQFFITFIDIFKRKDLFGLSEPKKSKKSVIFQLTATGGQTSVQGTVTVMTCHKGFNN